MYSLRKINTLINSLLFRTVKQRGR